MILLLSGKQFLSSRYRYYNSIYSVIYAEKVKVEQDQNNMRRAARLLIQGDNWLIDKLLHSFFQPVQSIRLRVLDHNLKNVGDVRSTCREKERKKDTKRKNHGTGSRP